MFDFLTLSELYTQIISKFKQLIISSVASDRVNMTEVLLTEFIKINAAFKTADFLEEPVQPPAYLQSYVEYAILKDELSSIKNILASVEENLKKYNFDNNQNLVIAANQLMDLAAKEKSMQEINAENPFQKILAQDGIMYNTPKALVQLMIAFYKKSCKCTDLFLETTNNSSTAGELTTGTSNFSFYNEAINTREEELTLLLQYQQAFSVAFNAINTLDNKDKSFMLDAIKELNRYICSETIKPADHKNVIQKILSRSTNISNASLIENVNNFIVTHINFLEFQHLAYDGLKNLKKRLSKSQTNTDSNSNSSSSYRSYNSSGTSQFFHYQSTDEELDTLDDTAFSINGNKKKKSSCLIM